MTIVSIKDFETNQAKYFDIAESEQVFIQRGESLFIVSKTPEKFKLPDDDLSNAVTMDVVKDRLHKHINKLFSSK
jgi:hypothetical protein